MKKKVWILICLFSTTVLAEEYIVDSAAIADAGKVHENATRNPGPGLIIKEDHAPAKTQQKSAEQSAINGILELENKEHDLDLYEDGANLNSARAILTYYNSYTMLSEKEAEKVDALTYIAEGLSRVGHKGALAATEGASFREKLINFLKKREIQSMQDYVTGNIEE